MTNEPTPNVDLLDQTLAHVTKLAAIKDEEGFDSSYWASRSGLDVWDQDCWLARQIGCGTVGCFAGWATVLAGEDVPYARVSSRARELLGLTKTEAIHLFYTGNDLEALSDEVQAIKDGMYR